MDHLAGALAWWDAGCSVVPVIADGSKRPFGYWQEYQQNRATREQVENWFKTSPNMGVGIICGAVSGNLEMLELEGRANTSEALSKISATIGAEGLAEEWNTLLYDGYAESTPSGGIHILYRIAEGEVPGNTKIARRPATIDELVENPKDRVKVLSETRGEGGFVVVAPSSGAVHKTGDSWSAIVGSVGMDVPVIERLVRDRIVEAIHDALDEMPEVARPEPSERPSVQRDGLSPGDDYCQKTPWGQLLESYGWTYSSSRGGEEFWIRPGKDARDDRDHSATLYYLGSDNLYVFSTSTELPAEEPISKFAFYAWMEHRGDFSAAAKSLYRDGYGDRGISADVSDWFTEIPYAGTGLGTVVDPSTPAVASAVGDTPMKVNPHITQFSEKGVGRFAGELLKDRVRFVDQERAWRVFSKGVWGRDRTQTVPRLMGKVSDTLDQRVEQMYSEAMEAVEMGSPEGKEALDVAKKLKTFAKVIASNRGMKAVAEIMSSTPGIGVSATEFDLNKDLVALNNGTMNLRTGVLQPHNPGDLLTKRIPLTFDEDARADRWEKYLEEVLPDVEYRDYLQRAAGMAMLGDTSEAAFFVLWGETGCGKSQFLEVMKAAFGEYGVTAASSTFKESRNGDDSRKSNSLHELRGARFVYTSETSEGTQLSGELVKRVTGGDTVTSHALYEREVEWRPAFTMFMGTNFRPTLNAFDGAIWRRVKPINFPRSFFVDGQATADREKGLADRIIATELVGVFNWIMRGVEQYLAIGLKDPDSMRESVRSYKEDSDPVLGFINEALDEGTLLADPEARMTVTDLYSRFVSHSRDNGVTRVLGKQKFGQSLDALGYISIRGSGGVRYRIGLKSNSPDWLVQGRIQFPPRG